MRFEPRSTFILGVAFLTGLLAPFTINVVGSLPLAEIVLIALAGAIVVQACLTGRIAAPYFREPLLWLLIAAQGLALVSYIVSDIFRETTTNDILRGWSRMIFLSLDIAGIAYLFGADRRSFLVTQIGLALSGFAAVAVYGAQYDAYWKFGFGAPITFVVLLLLPRLGFWLGTFSLFGLGFLHLVLDFRSFGAVCFMAGVLVLVTRLPRQLRVVTVIPSLIGAIALAIVFTQTRGHEQTQRGERSNVERSAMMEAAWEAVRESPMIGQGSWFSKSPVMGNFLFLRAAKAQEAGVHGYATDVDEKNMAIHSQILVSVAEGGLVGGTFFFVFGLALLWGLGYCTLWRFYDVNSPLYLTVLLLSVWNLLFSPFSGPHRLLIAFSCGLLLILWREARGKDEPEPEIEPLPETASLSPAHSS